MESTTTDRRIIGHMVTRNEHDRYLNWTLANLHAICDDVAIFDDNSTDGTYEYLRSIQYPFRQRGTRQPSFAVDESGFRGMAWAVMEDLVQPTDGDWVLCLDADEALAVPGGVRAGLDRAIDKAIANNADAVRFKVDEVFDVRAGVPYIRTDGFWGDIHAYRLVRWQPDGAFAPRIEGGGSVPATWTDPSVDADAHIVHFGYATGQDRSDRYFRYQRGTGHNPAHIESILGPPQLHRWEGEDTWFLR
jgi:glycosyltransferase involved in cell wall biosynthesis